MASSESGVSFDYDVFLSHSSADKPEVEKIAHRLLQESVRPFLDKWHLIPGDPWQEALEEALDTSRTCAVFLGPDGPAPWQNEEMRSALSDRVRDRSRRVIPVLLPAARRPASNDLPRFLRRATWVVLSDEDGFHRLLCGIRGLQPGPPEALPERDAPSAGERLLRGKVYHLGADNEPVAEPGFEVVCEETGKPATTDDNGFFDLPIPPAFQQGETVTIQVKKTGWRVRYPVNGEITLPADLTKTRVPIELLPNGSKLFLTHDQIEALIERISEESAREAQRSTSDDAPRDFGEAIRAWADARGLDPDQAREAVAAWVDETKDKSQDPRRLGLAALAEKRFGDAADHFETAAEHGLQHLEALAEERDRLRRQIVQDLRRQGDALSTAYRFRDAISAYERALELAPYDRMPHLWAATLNDLGNARRGQGIRTGGDQGRRLLQQAVTACRLELKVQTREELPQEWATTQNSLGSALSEQGIRIGGDAGRRLLDQAVTAFRLALEVRTRDELPQEWAATQNSLGNALSEQGIRTGGDAGPRLLDQAVTAYRLALEVRTRDELPEEWAATQNNLGAALQEQGHRTGGEESRQLLEEAVTALRSALEVQTRDKLPQEWAMIQNNLGLALLDQSTRTGGDQGRQLLQQAVTACRLALEVRTRDELPQDWAGTQNNLGNALREQGVRNGGNVGRRHLRQALRAYEKSLEIFTKDHLPGLWEIAYRNLGKVLLQLGRRDEAEAVFEELGGSVPDLAEVSGEEAGHPSES